MSSVRTIFAKGMIWAVALLIPVEAIPKVGCTCAQAGATTSFAREAPRCPHCATRDKTQRGGCNQSGNHQQGPAGCCCHQKNTLASEDCRCGMAETPTPNLPASNNLSDVETKGVAFCAVLMTAVVDCLPIPVFTTEQHVPTSSTSLERLSTLCRLVI